MHSIEYDYNHTFSLKKEKARSFRPELVCSIQVQDLAGWPALILGVKEKGLPPKAVTLVAFMTRTSVC